MKSSLFLFFLLLIVSPISYSANTYWLAYNNAVLIPGKFGNATDACAAAKPPAPACVNNRTQPHSAWPAGASTAYKYCRISLYNCATPAVFQNNTDIGNASLYTCPPNQVFDPSVSDCRSCPAGFTYSDGECAENCSSIGLVHNPHTNSCQSPCPVDYSDEPPWEEGNSISVGIPVGTTCNGDCLIEWVGYAHTNEQGFIESYNAQQLTGLMCSVGTLSEPPLTPPSYCPSPSIIRSDGTCGSEDPQCPSWQHLENHACVDTPCTDGKLLKCGTVDGTQVCACSGITDCEPGTVKNAFGNCISQPNCLNGQTMNPVTGVCEDAPADCPEGTHREGMICAKDPGECQPGTWFIPGCGCVSDINSCANRNSNDMDGDGVPNNQDDDADGDGIPNSQDSDADNDGIPNAVDPTPRGLGTGPGDGQSADRDNDGTPDNQDDDIDGDGVPNNQDSDIDGDGVPNDQDSTPNNQDPSKTRDTSKSDPNGDLDGDGVPNNQDGDRDGDGIPNGDDATPDGRGDGTGVNDGQCNPATEQCGDGNDKPGKPAALDDRFYTKKEDRSFQTIWASFISRVQSSRLVTAGTHFFSAPSGGGSCPTWQIPSTFISSAIPITLQCSSEVLSALRIAGIIVTIVAAWLAFRIALL